MTTLVTVKFQKLGAVFSTADEASDDRYVGADPTLLEETAALNTTFLANGVMSAPNSKTWDQDTNTLTVVKYINSIADYDAGWAPFGTELNTVAVNNGWTLVSKEVVEQ